MAVDDSSTGRSTPTEGKKNVLTVRRRKASGRRRDAITPKSVETPPADQASFAPAPAEAKQVDISVLGDRPPAEGSVLEPSRRAAQPARRVRVKANDRNRPPMNEAIPVPTESAAGSNGPVTPQRIAEARVRGGRRRPLQHRRGKPPLDEVPTSPAEALGPIADVPEVSAEPGDETPSWLDESEMDVSEARDISETDQRDRSVAPADITLEDRDNDAQVISVEPEPEPVIEEVLDESDAGRGRRRRGRRGRRGSSRPQEGPPGAQARPLKPNDRPVRLPLRPAEIIEEDEGLEDFEQEPLDTELAITPFTPRDPRAKGKPGRELIINISPGFECRVGILHEKRLEELFIERESTQSHVGNIYKGRITNVEPSIQAAFVDFGLEKNGFLHISDVQPQYFPNHSGGAEDVGRKIPRHQRPPIQRCFRRGQEVIVQITKEGVGTKGPTLTSYLSIPGRFLVMMPGMSHTGVSRKIEDEAARKRMREVLNQLTLPKGLGFILRTAGLDRPKRELQRDLNYLLRLWKTVVERIKNQPAPAELYRESDLVIRTLRDVYTSDFSRIVVDDAATARKVREFLRIAMPRTKVPIELYADRQPLFHCMGIEAEIERINMRHVPLPSGGSLVIDSTEAMVAIDVNSGRFRAPDDAEETALRINVEAAEEIARQLRLRDLGGLIVCDFIDMRHERNKRKVEQALREALKKHKERARILRMSAFGLIEMTRQRQGPSIRKNLYHDCPHCRGSGQVKLPESVMLDAMRLLQLAAHQQQVHKITIALSPDVAYALLNRKRSVLQAIETETSKKVTILGNAAFTSDQMEILCEDTRGREVTIGGSAKAN